jgi:malonate decarboxylase gamma subunit
LPHERLVSLAASSPTFAPGAENYLRMGAIEAIWDQPSSALLDHALAQLLAHHALTDPRMDIGLAREGRNLAAKIVAAVMTA